MGYELNRSVPVSELSDALGFAYSGRNLQISNVVPSDQAGDGSFCFTPNPEVLPASAIAISDFDSPEGAQCIVLHSESIRLDFIRCLDWLVSNVGFSTWAFESQIHESARIHPSAVVERGCVIGSNVIVEPNVTIHSGTRIGSNSRIRSNSSIGGDGFGFERLDGNTSIRFPHLAGVLIGKSVEIGACTCIARGTLADTKIYDYAKIDNLVHIAHNCHIRSGAYVIAGAEVSGGVVVGENSWISPNACVLQKVKIGANSLVGLGAVVTKNVEDGVIVAGNPAKMLRKSKNEPSN